MMQLPSEKAGDDARQRILSDREANVLSGGARKYFGQFGQAILDYFRHELEWSNRVYEKMEKGGNAYVKNLQEKGMFRMFPRLRISDRMGQWIVTYGPLAVSVKPELRESCIEQRAAIRVPEVAVDHLKYLLGLQEESAVESVTEPPQPTRTVVERATPHISLNPLILTLVKENYKLRFPTAVAAAMHPHPLPESLNYHDMSGSTLGSLIAQRMPTEDEYKVALTDKGFAELLNVLGVDIKGILASDREVIEAYSKAWKLPGL